MERVDAGLTQWVIPIVFLWSCWTALSVPGRGNNREKGHIAKKSLNEDYRDCKIPSYETLGWL